MGAGPDRSGPGAGIGLLGRPEGKLCHFQAAKATGCIERYSSALGFLLDNGNEIGGRSIVLCLGVGNARLPFDLTGLPAGLRPHIIENPWRLSWLRRVGKTDTVCILGSGLTMIDQVLALSAHGFPGKIIVLSRRGLVPHDHASHPKPAVDIDVEALPMRMSELLHVLRRESKDAGDWRRVMDGLRPKTQALWSRLPEIERRRFLRHALPWWNIHRHRVAPDVFRRFERMLQSGQVSVRAGHLRNVEKTKALTVHYRPRGESFIASIEADWIVNCTGMERAGIAHSPLLQEMRRKGLIEADPLGLGLVVDERSRIPGSSGKEAIIYAVGALTAGQFWEITAVPDIRVQARKVAEAIADRLP